MKLIDDNLIIIDSLNKANLKWLDRIHLVLKLHQLMLEQDSEWTKQKTAELVEKDIESIRSDIDLALKLYARPDIFKIVKSCSRNVAVKIYNQITHREKIEKLISTGKIIENKSLLVNEDAKDALKDIEPNSFHMLLTDPPYGIADIDKPKSNVKYSKENKYQATIKKSDNKTLKHTIQLFNEIAPDLFRILKPGSHIYIFSTIELFLELKNILNNSGFEIENRPLIWNKKTEDIPFNGYKPAPSYELILFGYKPPRKKRLNKVCKDIFSFPPVETDDKIHPFQKPEELLIELIELSTKPNEKVLDIFSGSGSTITSALKCNRKPFGIEKCRDRYLDAIGKFQSANS